MSSERLSGSTREGRGKRKVDSLSLALEAEAEQKAKRVKRVKSPKPSPPTKSKAIGVEQRQPLSALRKDVTAAVATTGIMHVCFDLF